MDMLSDISLADLLVFPFGFGLGIFYFTSLWFTVKKMAQAKHPVLIMIASGVARLTLVLVGFYFLIDSHWQRLLIAMVGFLIARSLLIACWRPGPNLDDLILED
jgi:F1F0 ATPase subunit 2